MDNKNIKDEIKEIKLENKEQRIIVSRYIIVSLVKSFIAFGYNHPITKECYDLYKQLKSIIEYENNIYKFIMKNVSYVNYDEFVNLVDKLDELNEDTVMYFYSMLEDIEDACQTKQEFRVISSKRQFKFITETDEYINEALGLVLTEEDIKKFLNYSNDFWNYVGSRVRKVDSHGDEKNIIYETIMHLDKNNCLDDMRIYVPGVINLKTALINVYEFKYAHDLFDSLGSVVSEDSSAYEESAKEKTKEFVKNYLPTFVRRKI